MREPGFETMQCETSMDRNRRQQMSNSQVVVVIALLLLGGVTLVTYLGTGRKPTFRPTEVSKPAPDTLLQVSETNTADTTSASNKDGSGHGDGLGIAWLMSFPNSGTSFTSKLVRHVTMGSTGSNYGHEVAPTDAVVPMFGDGRPPYWIDPHSLEANAWSRPVAPSLVLTKTHCGGRCEMCGPTEYVENPHLFLSHCLSGRASDEPVAMEYDMALVRKAVHLIRNPLDNVVSRFHLERKLFSDRGDARFSSDRKGFLSFCQLLKDQYGADEINSRWLDPQIYEMIGHVPCFADFIRYVQWHNLAFVVTQDMAIPTFVLHYEKFESNFDETVDELIEFLEVPRKGGTIEFILGKVYRDYFTDEEYVAIRDAIKIMALSTTWDNVQHYFGGEAKA